MRDITIEIVKQHLESNKRIATIKVDELRLKMIENAAYALSWSDSAFTAAGEIAIADYILFAMRDNNELTMESLNRYITRDVIRMAQFIEHSTSQCSNMIDRAKLAAYAKLMEFINF